eukprot:6387036-Amphidinium_carterae.1
MRWSAIQQQHPVIQLPMHKNNVGLNLIGKSKQGLCGTPVRFTVHRRHMRGMWSDWQDLLGLALKDDLGKDLLVSWGATQRASEELVHT